MLKWNAQEQSPALTVGRPNTLTTLCYSFKPTGKRSHLKKITMM